MNCSGRSTGIYRAPFGHRRTLRPMRHPRRGCIAGAPGVVLVGELRRRSDRRQGWWREGRQSVPTALRVTVLPNSPFTSFRPRVSNTPRIWRVLFLTRRSVPRPFSRSTATLFAVFAAVLCHRGIRNRHNRLGEYLPVGRFIIIIIYLSVFIYSREPVVMQFWQRIRSNTSPRVITDGGKKSTCESKAQPGVFQPTIISVNRFRGKEIFSLLICKNLTNLVRRVRTSAFATARFVRYSTKKQDDAPIVYYKY